MTDTSKNCDAQVELSNKHGLHARPAHMFVQTANAYASQIMVSRADVNESVDGKSIMGMMMLAAERGTVLRLRSQGPDADQQVRALVELIQARFGED
ncbi:phosphocarrier protein HPr [Planctomycetota bacterium]|jgi:phosphocarrier protein|nr:HPr family phosphocarrier protein [Planctomycetota bacterium]MSR39323.1 HPr family phosphocarrier protein [Planctomycetota bacterium]GDY01031.1 phosphocarrier protein HPr [Planctomycetota bacterium]